jgi:hypothetical protein
MGNRVEFTTHSARGRCILDLLERETGMPASGTSESRRAYDLRARDLDADTFLRALSRMAPDWFEHMGFLTLM